MLAGRALAGNEGDSLLPSRNDLVLGMVGLTPRTATALVILLVAIAFLAFAPMAYTLQPVQTDCVGSGNGVWDCGPPRNVAVPLASLIVGCLVLTMGILLLRRYRPTVELAAPDR